MRASGVVRVASVPAGHVYVRHLADPDGADSVVRLADPPPADGARVPGRWWPPAMLEPEWVRAHRDEFDVFHVHFGFDAQPPQRLRELTRTLDALSVPLVVTVHDLRNPHHDDVALHDAQLDVLIEGAAALVTLTPGAATEIHRRWGRAATVLAHPHVVDPPLLGMPRPARGDGFTIGLHAKSLRANMDVVGVARAIARTLPELSGARLRINLHDEVLDPHDHSYAPAPAGQLRALAAGCPQVELVVHPYFGDDELWAYLGALDVSVLPYRFGTHSGWLEACHDLGTIVVAPSCGFYAEQQPVLTYAHDDRGLDPESLARAIRAAYARRPRWQATVAQRMQERRQLAQAHAALYARLLA
ncbi:hypothetical protein Q5424_18900 [Conexibacter sp. JD483]|uniref:hypothetical protein n=1 Tax=Conexibacter sp. CPCC 205706 TaxID=3064572 RepID=UPI002715B7B1|nr:hypothetical protein [Conexibacter sp. CPCC 205706]MDO8188522.1 hypothetical protein [Conexibacter sp. CPCC 205706]MDO8200134.1 hypothetical protein [Conexibacter sp. CPCC 205762]MDR9371173.1 hypothetical protein [Conexibacter sp. JD483]